MLDNKRLSLLAHVATTEWIDGDSCAVAYWTDLISTNDVRGTSVSASYVHTILATENQEAASYEWSHKNASKPKLADYDPLPGRMLDAIAYAQKVKPEAFNVQKNDLALQVLLIVREYEHQTQAIPSHRYRQAQRIIEGIKSMLCQVLTYDVPISDSFGEGWNDRYVMDNDHE